MNELATNPVRAKASCLSGVARAIPREKASTFLPSIGIRIKLESRDSGHVTDWTTRNTLIPSKLRFLPLVRSVQTVTASYLSFPPV